MNAQLRWKNKQRYMTENERYFEASTAGFGSRKFIEEFAACFNDQRTGFEPWVP